MTPIRRASSLTVLVAPRRLSSPPARRPILDSRTSHAAPTPAPTAAPAATSTVAAATAIADRLGACRARYVATPNAVTIDVTDASKSLIGAASGTPGDGASVEAVHARGHEHHPDDPSPDLGRRAVRQRQQPLDRRGPPPLVVVQPECPGDAIATDRVLDLEFATPIKASEIETFLQDGLDT